MITQNLKDAYKAFSPTPLEDHEAVNSFYVNRGGNLVKLLDTFGDQSTKILFTGHRGSGKTTELNHAATELAAKYSIFNLKVGKYLDIKQFDSKNILSAIIQALGETSIKPGIQRKILRESVPGIGTFGGKTEIIKEIIIEIKDENYLQKLNEALKKVEKQTGKSVLIFVDDLDKQVHRFDEILLKEGDIFNKIDCSLVLTVPLTTIYSDMSNRITERFNHVEVLPNISPYKKNGSIDEAGIEVLKGLVWKRMDPSLITGKALETAALFSGGVFRYLVKMMQDSVFKAMTADREQIKEEDIEESIEKMRSEFGRIIGVDDYEILKKIHEKKNLINVETDIRFIANDIVLEYQNSTRWNDIHPVVKDLLPGY